MTQQKKPSCPRLTSREVIQPLAEENSTKEVATIRGLSIKTRETNRSNIYVQLRLHGASELALDALPNNIPQETDSGEWSLLPPRSSWQRCVVDNKMDKQIAETQARAVSGAFSVENKLVVAKQK